MKASERDWFDNAYLIIRELKIPFGFLTGHLELEDVKVISARKTELQFL